MKNSNKPSILPVIAARGGSKGLPRKNIRLINGLPMIGYSIYAAKNSKYLSTSPVVSTDDPEIARISERLGARVPFIRPPELASDETTIHPVLVHALNWLATNDGYNPEYVMLLQPTSPLRTSLDIDSAIDLAMDNDADSVVSVCSSQHHPYLSKNIIDGKLSNFLELDRSYNRRQEFPELYSLNGAIYLVKSEILIQHQTFYTDNTYGYIMPSERSIDIDSQFDMDIAEFIIMRHEQQSSPHSTDCNGE